MKQLQAGETIGDVYPYRLVRRLDAGAMAEVWLASVESEQSDAGEPPEHVVLKIVNLRHKDPSFVAEAFDNEVEHLRKLQHPAIVHIFPIIHKNLRNLPYRAQTSLPGKPWFCSLEYLAGSSLREVIQDAPHGLEPGYAISIAHRLASALDYLHAKRRVHLDIKPKNILFRYPAGNQLPTGAVLVDFGVSRYEGQGGLSGGTRRYAAPERLVYQRTKKNGDEAPLRPAASMDIYSLGIVMYEMLTGNVPFRGTGKQSTTDAIIEAKPAPPSTRLAGQVTPEVAVILDEVVLQTIEPDPEKRPTAPILAARLEEASFRLGYPHRNLFLPIQAQDDRTDSTEEDMGSPVAATSLPFTKSSTLGQRVSMSMALAVAAIFLLLLGSGVGYAVGKASPEVDEVLEPTLTNSESSDNEGSAPPTATSEEEEQQGELAEEMGVATAIISATLPSTTLQADPNSRPETEIDADVAPTPAATLTATPTLTATATSTPTATPTRSRVTWATIDTPENGLVSNSNVTFAWRPNGFLPAGSRYNIVLCQQTTSQPQFALCNTPEQLRENGFSISDGTGESQITVDVSDVLRREGRTLAESYWWAVAVYYAGQEQPAYLVSEPRVIVPE